MRQRYNAGTFLDEREKKGNYTTVGNKPGYTSKETEDEKDIDQKQCRQRKHLQKENNQKTKVGEKHLYQHFKRLTSDISHEKTWTWLRKILT